jgi:hypothetical protein
MVLCARGRNDVIDALNADTGSATGFATGLRPARLQDALPASPGFTALARVAAIATHAVATTDLPGLETGARVDTPDGPVRSNGSGPA